MRLYGLIGYPLEHSLSPELFAKKWRESGVTDCRYMLFPIRTLRELPGLLQSHPELEGLNVTSPYKRQVLSVVDGADETALRIGGANVLSIGPGMRITAYNTDHTGFDRILDSFDRLPEKAIVCGTGGAARAVRYSLERHGICTTLVSRHPESGQLAYENVTPELFASCRMVVNATPLGRGSDKRYPPLPYQSLTPEHLLVDLNYATEPSPFLLQGKPSGCRCTNGIGMLKGQADAAWEIWNRRNGAGFFQADTADIQSN